MPINNSIYIKNSLKSPNQGEILKTLQLLSKLGIIPNKSKKKQNKQIKDGMGEDEIKSSSDHMKGYTSVIPSTQPRYSPRQVLQIGGGEPVLTIEDVKDIQKQSDARLALLQDQMEKTQEQQGMITAYGGILGSQLAQVQQRIREGGMSQGINPFKDVKGQGVTIEEYEVEDVPFSNQGSQDIPDDLMKVDVSPMPTEILEDEEDVGDEPIIIPEKQGGGLVGFAEPEAEPELAPVIEQKKKKEIQLIDPFKKKMIEVVSYHQILEKPSSYKDKATFKAYLNELSKLGYTVELDKSQTKADLEKQVDNIIELEYKKIKKLKKKSSNV